MPTNVFADAMPRIQSPIEVQNGLAQGALAQSQLQSSQLALQTRQDQLQQRAALANGLASGDLDLSNPAHVSRAMALAPDVAPAIIKTIQEGNEKAAKAKSDLASAGKAEGETSAKALETYRSFLPMVKTPEQFGQWVDGLYNDPRTAKVAQQFGSPDQVKARVPTDPAQFQQFLQQNAMGMDNFIKNQTQVRGQDLTAQTSRANNADTNKTHIQAAGIAASTSRANNAATIAKDYKVAGIDPQTGNFVGGADTGTSSLVDLVGSGKMTLQNALSRTPSGQKERFAQELQKRYPDFDPAALATRTAAEKAFTTGKEAQMLRSIGTANKHLDMVGGMVDALNNGNIQVFNKLGQAYAQQTGGTAPTNFDAAKEIVGQEVVKSIVANGGGVKEREEAAAALDKAKSPAQLRGVIQTYKTIMGAQRESLLQQRRAAGLPDSTIPDYTEAKPASASALPSGWKIEKVGN